MALLVLILIGALLGWLASILARTEEPGEILRQIGIGMVAALVAGLIVNGGSLLGGLSLASLGAALAAAVVLLALYHGAMMRMRA
jgi:uncharacterized membrane protein YeaQ/YmgE (transglycosylase-associated protein family)